MDYSADKVDDMILALMSLGLHRDEFYARVWKSFDWDGLNRLHKKGFIGDPINKAKSVEMTAEGLKRSEQLFEQFFCEHPKS